VEEVAQACRQFLQGLFEEKCPKDIHSRLWSSQIQDALAARNEAALRELDLIMEDIQSYPINYNHYYTDTIRQRRNKREKESLAQCIEDATSHTHLPGCNSTHTSTSIDVDKALQGYAKSTDPDIVNHSCEEVLDCLIAIYKVGREPVFTTLYEVNRSPQVLQKTFIANVTTQVVERHIVRGLEEIFSPVVVNGLSDPDVEGIASEPASAKRQRAFLEDRIAKLKEGHEILRSVRLR
jgi:hypothetical protein